MLAGLKCSKNSSHSHAEGQRTSIVSELETYQSLAVTHKLKSREQALSAGLKHSKA